MIYNGHTDGDSAVEIKTEPGTLKRSSPIHSHHSPEKKPHLDTTLSPDVVPTHTDDGQF